MAYKIKKRTTYRWTIEHVLEVRQGVPILMSFDAEFNAIGQTRINELMVRAQKLDIKDRDFLDEVLAEMHELEGDDGKVYRKADIDELVEMFPGFLRSLARGWTESVLGAARKN